MLSSKLALNNEEFNLLREYIQKECGVQVGDDNAYLIESRLARLVVDTDCKSFKEFYLKARSDVTGKLRSKVIDAMTSNETTWFRDEKPWDIISEVIIPSFISDLKTGRKQRITIWSAACSTGQEPYSFAMLLHQAIVKEQSILPKQFEILATDISPSALFMAISGRYNSASMSRGMRADFQDLYFEQCNHTYQIIDLIRRMVKFKQFNLLNSFDPLPDCDLCLCSNIVGLFSSDVKRKLFRKLHDKINDDGYLIMGLNEGLSGYSEDFEQLTYKNALYYRPKQ